ncbi:MAG: aldehyde dehydrogenase family protein [Natronomonas sp.]
MTARSASNQEKLYIGGDWKSGADYIEVEDLADGGIFAQVTAATPEDALDALAAAQQAQAAMSDLSIVERADWLSAIADGIEDRKPELTEIIVREAGKPISSARGEVESAAERFRRAVEEVRALDGEYLEGTTDGHEGWQAIVKPEPVGTVLCITPYNYPLATTALQVAPALAAGNSTILKPATKTPISAAVLSEVVVESAEAVGIELPDGAFSFVPGRADEIGDVLAGDDRIDAIAMTGSTGAGKHVAGVSGMVELHMELGGNAPAVVFPDADLEDVADGCTAGSFKYAGQRCSAVSRILAHDDVHDAVVDRIAESMDGWETGDLFDPDTAVGPLISEEQADWVEELIDDAVAKGATLVRGGQRDGQAIEPTLLADVPADARIVHEEQFGPVAAVTRFEDETEALAIANGGDLGLDAAVYTSEYDRAMRVADALEAGAVRINGPPSHGLGDIPFGGMKDSGIGREGIGRTIDAFTQTKSIIL